jgi:transcriptional regulator with XRE-family HTH domain
VFALQSPFTQKVECYPTIRGVAFIPMGIDYKRESGKRLSKAREAKKWTLRELSQSLGGLLSPSRLSNYEQGIRRLSQREALALASVLNVQASYLLCIEVEEEEMTAQEQELLRNFRALPEKDRNAYARRIEVLALAYKEPVPDEKLPLAIRRGAPKRRSGRRNPA